MKPSLRVCRQTAFGAPSRSHGPAPETNEAGQARSRRPVSRRRSGGIRRALRRRRAGRGRPAQWWERSPLWPAAAPTRSRRRAARPAAVASGSDGGAGGAASVGAGAASGVGGGGGGAGAGPGSGELSRSCGARQTKASSAPEGEAGAQRSLMIPSAIHALSRGARAARASHSRAAPSAPSAVSMSAISRQVRAVGRLVASGAISGPIAARAAARSRASSAARPSVSRLSGSSGARRASVLARAKRSAAESPRLRRR